MEAPLGLIQNFLLTLHLYEHFEKKNNVKTLITKTEILDKFEYKSCFCCEYISSKDLDENPQSILKYVNDPYN